MTTTTPNPVGELDLHLFNEGTHRHLHRCLGAHPDPAGTWFAVWAPNAAAVDVLGDFDGWRGQRLEPVGSSGIWSAYVAGARPGQSYRYAITTPHGERLEKADPVGAATNVPPSTASVIADLDHEWHDGDWMARRKAAIQPDAPIAIYELHVGSWGRIATPGRRFPTYDELADPIADHVLAHGFTHVELLPIMEHPFYGSWGYQTTGYFAPTARYGTPQQLMAMIDRLHERGVGVILDWVPSHFPMDAHGLARFDGTHLYEHEDPRQGYHPDWTSAIFNYGRKEVRSFLLSSALCWLDRFHVDGLRVDAVASMLYLDYSRQAGEWVPNREGGRENLDAIDFLRQMNTLTHAEHPGSITIAEESTAWPSVSRPTYVGGLGFTYKWNMGWMNDILEYVRQDPIYRRWYHRHITFSLIYAFSENFILPFSHDEVVHGKGSMFGKIPGDDWQKAATLRALYGFMYAHPGKKLMFMGAEFGQGREWNYDQSLDWHLLDSPVHAGIKRFVTDLNRVYCAQPALHAQDFEGAGFEWIDCNDNENSVVSLIRRAPDGDIVVVVLNFTPVPRDGYRIGVPIAGSYDELINSDAAAYGGGNLGNAGVVFTEEVPSHGHDQSLRLNLPPLACLLLKPQARVSQPS